MSKTNFSETPFSPFLWKWFHWYAVNMFRQEFNQVRIVKQPLPEIPLDKPLIVYINHPSWWDPLLAVVLSQKFFPDREFTAPIAAEALEKYPLFRKLGFYPLDLETLSGTKHFLQMTRKRLETPGKIIWITPQGRFTDVRDQPQFKQGLAHLAATLNDGYILPMAFEFTFWEERTPEALVLLGDPFNIEEFKLRQTHEGHPLTKEAWNSLLTEKLHQLQTELAELSIKRAVDRFETLLDGAAGVGGFYDLARRITAFIQGKKFDPRHGSTSQNSQSTAEQNS